MKSKVLLVSVVFCFYHGNTPLEKIIRYLFGSSDFIEITSIALQDKLRTICQNEIVARRYSTSVALNCNIIKIEFSGDLLNQCRRGLP